LVLTVFKDGRQDSFPLYENVLLVEADSPDDARTNGLAVAKDAYEGDSGGTYTHDGRQATAIVVGVRKVIECVNSKAPPQNGVEVTYSRMYVNTKEELQLLMEGKPVSVLYEE
jgi:hypothetical protein